MSTDTEMVREQLEAQAAHITEAVAHFEDDEHDEHDCDEFDGYGDDLWEWVDSDVLSVECVWRGSLMSPAELDHIVIVLCTGGPHVEMRFDGSNATYHGWGWFEAGRQTLSGDAAAEMVGSYFWEFAGEMGPNR